jgi:hypothetical protein
MTGTVWMRTRSLPILLGVEKSICSVDDEQLDRCFKWSFIANVQMPGAGKIGNCTFDWVMKPSESVSMLCWEEEQLNEW